MPNDGGHLLLSMQEAEIAISKYGVNAKFIRPFLGSEDFIQGKKRRCIWVKDNEFAEAEKNIWLEQRFQAVKKHRMNSPRKTTQVLAAYSYKFGEVRQEGCHHTIVIPRVSSEERPYLPVGLCEGNIIISDRNFALYDAPLWNMALIASRLHWVWIATVCARMRTDFSYSNTLGWNTFPVPLLTEQNKADLSECAENILLAREIHFPATIAELYKADAMPENLRHAHDYNDEVIERIYIGRRFKNDSERLEKLFALYSEMTTGKKE